MPVISLRVSQKQYDTLQKEANQNNMPVYAYIMNKLFPLSVSSDKLSIEQVMKRISSLKSGEEFTIEKLYTPEEWNIFSNKETIGRIFRQQSKIPDSCVDQTVEFVQKVSGKSAVYRKK
ncbi:MAG: DUF1413 domain-containing protein [Oscillospiraceae bacterium]|nr:DUF1413 domain-containing protein [Oscillospiraceae bacterium]